MRKKASIWSHNHKITHSLSMMTSSNGNIFRVTGPLCGEFTGPGEFPAQRPVTWSFDVFCDLRLNKRLSKQQWGWWFETPSRSLRRHCNATIGCLLWVLSLINVWCLQVPQCYNYITCYNWPVITKSYEFIWWLEYYTNSPVNAPFSLNCYLQAFKASGVIHPQTCTGQFFSVTLQWRHNRWAR